MAGTQNLNVELRVAIPFDPDEEGSYEKAKEKADALIEQAHAAGKTRSSRAVRAARNERPKGLSKTAAATEAEETTDANVPQPERDWSSSAS